MDYISLFALNGLVKQSLKERFQEPVWVAAEIASVQEHSKGHCYLELMEKAEGEDKPRAVAKGVIWAFVYRMLKPYFESETGRSLERGMKILVQVEPVFHEAYGYSLNIKDIEPTFTLGDMERRRREILVRLEEEGVIDMNRNLSFPVLPKCVAVISSPTAAGYGDFVHQLSENPYGYCFHTALFPAVMQGEQTTESVVAALDRIYSYGDLFDVVVIIRGGGAQSELGSFDSYDLALNVAQFPLPVIAGIGHDRDETIVDRVAHLRVKTPTAAAAVLIDAFRDSEGQLNELQTEFVEGVRDVVQGETARQRLLVTDLRRLVQAWMVRRDNDARLLTHELRHAVQQRVFGQKGALLSLSSRVNTCLNAYFERKRMRLGEFPARFAERCRFFMEHRHHSIDLVEAEVRMADPLNVLKRGYTITRRNGKAVRSAKELKKGDEVVTTFVDGTLTSKV